MVLPEVFHPGFFFSTKFLLRYLSGLPMQNKSVLELGAGAGLISIVCAKRGAMVTATDINPVSISCLDQNKKNNQVDLCVIESDLFDHIPQQHFDYIAINPPYYKKAPSTLKEHAWYCGMHGEYFERLFKTLKSYMHNRSVVLMVLSEDCDMNMIRQMAKENALGMDCVQERKNLLETNYIFKIGPLTKAV